MKIGLISKKEHVKPFNDALTRLGHRLELLGGGHGIVVPQSVEALILRTASCSHTASDVALRWARESGRPLIVQNGLTSVLAELRQLQEEGKMNYVYLPALPPYSELPEGFRRACSESGLKNAQLQLKEHIEQKRPLEDLHRKLALDWFKDRLSPKSGFSDLQGNPVVFMGYILWLIRDQESRNLQPLKDLYEKIFERRASNNAAHAAALISGVPLTLIRQNPPQRNLDFSEGQTGGGSPPIEEVQEHPQPAEDSLETRVQGARWHVPKPVAEHLPVAEPSNLQVESLRVDMDKMLKTFESHILDLMNQISNLQSEVDSLKKSPPKANSDELLSTLMKLKELGFKFSLES